jgi:hypothetical protein
MVAIASGDKLSLHCKNETFFYLEVKIGPFELLEASRPGRSGYEVAPTKFSAYNGMLYTMDLCTHSMMILYFRVRAA